MLHGYCKEYVGFLNEFNDNVRASFSPSYDSVPGILAAVIDINFRTDYIDENFKIICYFDKSGNLFLKYPDDYNYYAEMKHVLGENSDTKKDFHVYQEEALNEPEKLEKEYIFQLFNNRIKQYLDVQNAKKL